MKLLLDDLLLNLVAISPLLFLFFLHLDPPQMHIRILKLVLNMRILVVDIADLTEDEICVFDQHEVFIAHGLVSLSYGER